MSTNRSRRIDRDAAEQLLGGAVGGPSAGQDASLTGPDGDAAGQVARVLAAAAAPATAAELTGEQAALAAFREARLAPRTVTTTAPVRRRSMATAALARAFSTKAVAAVLSATALCGVAVAAGTGNLPSPLGHGAEPERTLGGGGVPGAPSPSAHGPGSATPGGQSVRPYNGPSAGGSGGGAQGLGPSGSPTPGTPSATGRATQPLPAALVALCHAFGDRTDKGERPRQLVLDPVFAPLVAAAGGPDKVEDLCGEALGRAGDDARRSATPQPTHDDRQGSGGGNANGSGAADGNGNGADGGKGKGNGDGDGATGRNGGSGGATGGNTTNGGGAKPGRTGPALPAPPALPDVRPSGQDRQAAQG